MPSVAAVFLSLGRGWVWWGGMQMVMESQRMEKLAAHHEVLAAVERSQTLASEVVALEEKVSHLRASMLSRWPLPATLRPLHTFLKQGILRRCWPGLRRMTRAMERGEG